MMSMFLISLCDATQTETQTQTPPSRMSRAKNFLGKQAENAKKKALDLHGTIKEKWNQHTSKKKLSSQINELVKQKAEKSKRKHAAREKMIAEQQAALKALEDKHEEKRKKYQTFRTNHQHILNG